MTAHAICVGVRVIRRFAACGVAVVATGAALVGNRTMIEARGQPGLHLMAGIAGRQSLDMSTWPRRCLNSRRRPVAARTDLRCALQNAILVATFAGSRLMRPGQDIARGGMVEVLLATGWCSGPQRLAEKQGEPQEQASPIKLAFHGLLLCVAGRRSPKVVVLWQLAQSLPS